MYLVILKAYYTFVPCHHTTYRCITALQQNFKKNSKNAFKTHPTAPFLNNKCAAHIHL